MNSKHWFWDAPRHYIWRGVAIFLITFWSLVGYGIASCISSTNQNGKSPNDTVFIQPLKTDGRNV